MPSKRKKNKRRMRRVQAQRRALEEQHAANPPVKASRGIAVSAPPAATPKKAAKTPAPAPEKKPQAVPIVETPKVEPKPAVKEPVVEPISAVVAAPEPEAVQLKQIAEEVEVRVLPALTEETPVVEAPPVEPPTVEAAVEREAELIIPETESVTEVIPPAEAPVVAPAEIEVQTAEATVIKTEAEQTLDVCEKEAVEVEGVALTEEDAVAEEEEAEVEVAVSEDIAIPETVAAEEQVVEAEQVVVSAEVEAAAHEVVTDAVVEVVTEISEPEREVTEPAAPPAEEDEAEVLAEEEAPEVTAEADATTEDAPIQYVEIPVVPDTITEAPAEEAAAPLTEATEAIADTLVDDFVVTEPLSAVEVAIAESAAVQQEIVVMNDTLGTITESTDVTPPEPEPAAAPAEEIVTDASAEQTCLDMLSEEPKSEICDMPCQMQLAVETAEMSVETGLNAHIVPEVSIEG